MLLLDSLTFLVLSRVQVLQFLLMPLLELGIHPIGIARTRRRRTIVVDLRIAGLVTLARLIYSVRRHIRRLVDLARLIYSVRR